MALHQAGVFYRKNTIVFQITAEVKGLSGRVFGFQVPPHFRVFGSLEEKNTKNHRFHGNFHRYVFGAKKNNDIVVLNA